MRTISSGMRFLAAFICLSSFFLLGCEKQNSEFIISSEKRNYLKGESVFIKFSFENRGNITDTLYGFDDGTLSSKLILNSETLPLLPGEGGYELAKDFPSIIKPSEKKEIIAEINLFRGQEGAPTMSYFSPGKYKAKGKCRISGNRFLSTNELEFQVSEPEGNELDAFKDFRYFIDFYTKKMEPEERLVEAQVYVDKSVEFLHKYPKSVYTGNVLRSSFHQRYHGKYRFDESFINDIEYYISNNIDSEMNADIIGLIPAILTEKPDGKVRAKMLLENWKNKYYSERLAGQIDYQIRTNELLK